MVLSFTFLAQPSTKSQPPQSESTDGAPPSIAKEVSLGIVSSPARGSVYHIVHWQPVLEKKRESADPGGPSFAGNAGLLSTPWQRRVGQYPLCIKASFA